MRGVATSILSIIGIPFVNDLCMKRQGFSMNEHKLQEKRKKEK